MEPPKTKKKKTKSLNYITIKFGTKYANIKDLFWLCLYMRLYVLLLKKYGLLRF